MLSRVKEAVRPLLTVIVALAMCAALTFVFFLVVYLFALADA